MRNGNVVLEINDTGPGLTEAELDIKYEKYKETNTKDITSKWAWNTPGKMKRLFGEEVRHNLRKLQKQGIKTILLWPEHCEERTE